jgi:hypothetical protein
MKKQPYKRKLMNKIELVVNPSIILKEELIDLMVKFKVKIQAYKKNEDVFTDLYDLMTEYFSDKVIDEVLKSSFELEEIRDYKIKKIIE